MEFFDIDPKLRALGEQAEHKAREQFAQIDRVAQYNSEKVLSAFIKNGVSESHFTPSTGYGYGDRGREVMDAVLADIFGCEDALIRYNFMSGTHALTVALFGVLRPGDKMVSLTGMPYDTLHGVIGIGEKEGVSGSLKDFGIQYEQLDLMADGTVNYDAIPEAVKGAKVAYIQRSRGYSLRPSLFVEDIERIVQKVRQANPEAIVMVDNCYGEFVQEREPTQVGADLIVGSLIKNPGGGIAPTGGYIAGRAKYVEMCAQRLTAPGVGKEIGCTLGNTRSLFMGLFFAPTVVASALKTALFAASLCELLGYEVTPKSSEPRADIIQAVKLRHFPVGRGRIGREGNPRGVHLSGQGRRRTGAGYVQGHVRAQQALAGQGAGRAAAIHAQEAAALFQGRGQGGAAAATQIRHQIPGLAHRANQPAEQAYGLLGGPACAGGVPLLQVRHVGPYVGGVYGLVIVIAVELATAAYGAAGPALFVHGTAQVVLPVAMTPDGHPGQVKARMLPRRIHQDGVMLAAEVALRPSPGLIGPDDLIHERLFPKHLVAGQACQRAAPPVQVHVEHARIPQQAPAAVRQARKQLHIGLPVPFVPVTGQG